MHTVMLIWWQLLKLWVKKTVRNCWVHVAFSLFFLPGGWELQGFPRVFFFVWLLWPEMLWIVLAIILKNVKLLRILLRLFNFVLNLWNPGRKKNLGEKSWIFSYKNSRKLLPVHFPKENVSFDVCLQFKTHRLRNPLVKTIFASYINSCERTIISRTRNMKGCGNSQKSEVQHITALKPVI